MIFVITQNTRYNSYFFFFFLRKGINYFINDNYNLSSSIKINTIILKNLIKTTIQYLNNKNLYLLITFKIPLVIILCALLMKISIKKINF